MDKTLERKDNLWRQIFVFSLPLIISNILQVLFNTSDIAVVGKFAGINALGAVGSTSILVTLFTGLALGLGSGINVAASQFFGAKDCENVKKTVGSSLVVALIFGIIIGIVGIFISRPLLLLLSTKEEFIDGAVKYFRIYMFGMPALCLFNYGNAVYGTMCNTKKPLIFLASCGIINVLLNLLFVISCDLDVAGVALASIISQYLCAFITLASLTRVNNPFTLKISDIRVDSFIVKRVLSLGIPAGAQNAIFMIANLFIQAGVNSFDSILVAGNSAATNADPLIYGVMDAFYIACANFVGNYYGAKNKEKMKISYLISLFYSFIFAFIMGLVLIVFGRPFLSIFTSQKEVIDSGMLRISVMGFSYCISAFMDCTISASRGMGKTFIPTVFVISGSCIFRIIWIYTIFAYFHTIPSLYLLYVFSWTITAFAEIIYFVYQYKKIEKSFSLDLQYDTFSVTI